MAVSNSAFNQSMLKDMYLFSETHVRVYSVYEVIPRYRIATNMVYGSTWSAFESGFTWMEIKFIHDVELYV